MGFAGGQSGPKLYSFRARVSILRGFRRRRGSAGGRHGHVHAITGWLQSHPRPGLATIAGQPPGAQRQMSKKKKLKKIEARVSPIHGNGVFATDDIAEGERVIRYKGVLRTHDDVDEQYGDID